MGLALPVCPQICPSVAPQVRPPVRATRRDSLPRPVEPMYVGQGIRWESGADAQR